MACSRREFLQTGLSVALGAGAFATGAMSSMRVFAADADLPPVRTITRQPGFHWFGYYDKLQFDPAGRRVLGMEVDFEHRSPRPDDVIKVGVIDLEDDDRWTELGTSRSWGWQQGCMLQWRPGSASEVLWNDREGDRFVCHILNVDTGQRRTIPHPIYTVSPDGRTAIGLDFHRLQAVRPGYGYAGLEDPNQDELAPANAGLYAIDLDSGESQLIISLADIVQIGTIPKADPQAKHYFNHLLFNTDGSRFEFLHRWQYPDGHRLTRMLTADPDGKNIRVVDDNGLTSHFIWRDPHHILAFSEQPSHGKRFYLFDERTGEAEPVGTDVMTRDGHCTYLPGGKWILNDTYPDKDRNQTPFLYEVATGRIVPLGHFYLPPEYKGEWRCDTHPRFSPDGRSVVIDSPHTGQGRQMHLIDISGIVG